MLMMHAVAWLTRGMVDVPELLMLMMHALRAAWVKCGNCYAHDSCADCSVGEGLGLLMLMMHALTSMWGKYPNN